MSKVVEDCASMDKDGFCFCQNGCKRTSFFHKTERGYELAPRPDGRCYCGNPREMCPTFRAYGQDCQGFSSTRIESDRYKSDYDY